MPWFQSLEKLQNHENIKKSIGFNGTETTRVTHTPLITMNIREPLLAIRLRFLSTVVAVSLVIVLVCSASSFAVVCLRRRGRLCRSRWSSSAA